MSDYKFDNVEIFLIDSDLSSRQGARHILFNAGCRNIRVGDDCAEVKEVLAQHGPDLMIAELQLTDGNFADMTERIRKGEIGHNPFVPIILMVAPDEDVNHIKAALNAGVDDVVPKPISSKNLMARVDRVVKNRRPFVVTDDYVGPKRAQDEGARTIDAPNHFAQKLTGEKIGFLEMEMDVAAVAEDVKGARLMNIGDEMKRLVAEIAPRLEKGEMDDGLRDGLNSLVDEAVRAEKQFQNTRYEHVGELLNTLSSVSKLLRDVAPGDVDIRRALLLRPLCQAIQVGFAGGIESEEAAKAIVQQIGAGVLNT